MWSSMYAAYEALSPPIQEMCRGLTALHDAHPHDHAEQTAIHPVVRVHPDTGRQSLFVNEHFTRRIVELSGREPRSTRPPDSMGTKATVHGSLSLDGRRGRNCGITDVRSTTS